MIKFYNTVLILTALLTISGFGHLQAQDTTQTDDKTLAGQYREIIQKSKNNGQGYKIVLPSRLTSFNRNFTDSLRQTRSALSQAQSKIAVQNKAISSLKADVTAKEQNLAASKSMVDEISMLGIPVNKNTYNYIMWGLVISLGAGLAFVVFRSASYRKEARYRTNLFTELSEEFQTFKTKSNDKEKKLARELQTEKNRLDESYRS